jgi:hypothetical protein
LVIDTPSIDFVVSGQRSTVHATNRDLNNIKLFKLQVEARSLNVYNRTTRLILRPETKFALGTLSKDKHMQGFSWRLIDFRLILQ